MFLILNRALSWAITSFGNKFYLKKRSRLRKALDNRFYAKFMQLEIGLFPGSTIVGIFLRLPCSASTGSLTDWKALRLIMFSMKKKTARAKYNNELSKAFKNKKFQHYFILTDCSL